MSIEFQDSGFCRTVKQKLFIKNPHDLDLFCGNPRVCLCCWRDNLDVGIAVRDDDDFDTGVVYICTSKEEQSRVFEELINYLHDVRSSPVEFMSICDKSFFPDLGIEKTRW